MAFDGASRDDETVRYLGVAEPTADESGDLAFSVGEARPWLAGGLGETDRLSEFVHGCRRELAVTDPAGWRARRRSRHQ